MRVTAGYIITPEVVIKIGQGSRKRFSYFLLGRLRFGDDVASRKFAHLESDGLPLI